VLQLRMMIIQTFPNFFDHEKFLFFTGTIPRINRRLSEPKQQRDNPAQRINHPYG